MKLIDILKIINWSEKIIVIYEDNEIYGGQNDDYIEGDKYRVLKSCYGNKKVKLIASNESRHAILIYII